MRKKELPTKELIPDVFDKYGNFLKPESQDWMYFSEAVDILHRIIFANVEGDTTTALLDAFFNSNSERTKFLRERRAELNGYNLIAGIRSTINKRRNRREREVAEAATQVTSKIQFVDKPKLPLADLSQCRLLFAAALNAEPGSELADIIGRLRRYDPQLFTIANLYYGEGMPMSYIAEKMNLTTKKTDEKISIIRAWLGFSKSEGRKAKSQRHIEDLLRRNVHTDAHAARRKVLFEQTEPQTPMEKLTTQRFQMWRDVTAYIATHPSEPIEWSRLFEDNFYPADDDHAKQIERFRCLVLYCCVDLTNIEVPILWTADKTVPSHTEVARQLGLTHKAGRQTVGHHIDQAFEELGIPRDDHHGPVRKKKQKDV